MVVQRSQDRIFIEDDGKASLIMPNYVKSEPLKNQPFLQGDDNIPMPMEAIKPRRKIVPTPSDWVLRRQVARDKRTRS